MHVGSCKLSWVSRIYLVTGVVKILVVAVFVRFQAGLAALQFHGPPQTKLLLDEERSCMDSFLRARGLACAAGTRGGHRHFGILHTESKTEEMVIKEHMAALFHLLSQMF